MPTPSSKSKTPVPVAPVNGASVDGLAPTFTWEPLSGNSTYQLQIAVDDAFEQLVIDTSLESTTITLYSTFPQDGSTYHWRVGVPGQGRWSSPTSFRATGQNEAPVRIRSTTAATTPSKPMRTATTSVAPKAPPVGTIVAPYSFETTNSKEVLIGLAIMVITIVGLLISIPMALPK